MCIFFSPSEFVNQHHVCVCECVCLCVSVCVRVRARVCEAMGIHVTRGTQQGKPGHNEDKWKRQTERARGRGRGVAPEWDQMCWAGTWDSVKNDTDFFYSLPPHKATITITVCLTYWSIDATVQETIFLSRKTFGSQWTQEVCSPPRWTWPEGPWTTQQGGREGGRRERWCFPGWALQQCWVLEGSPQRMASTVSTLTGIRPVTTSCLLRPLALHSVLETQRKASVGALRAHSLVRVADGGSHMGQGLTTVSSLPPPPPPPPQSSEPSLPSDFHLIVLCTVCPPH